MYLSPFTNPGKGDFDLLPEDLLEDLVEAKLQLLPATPPPRIVTRPDGEADLNVCK